MKIYFLNIRAFIFYVNLLMIGYEPSVLEDYESVLRIVVFWFQNGTNKPIFSLSCNQIDKYTKIRRKKF